MCETCTGESVITVKVMTTCERSKLIIVRNAV